jgi:hypothetical protein
MANQNAMTEDVYIVLSSYERAMVHAVQTRKPGATPINWKALAEDIKVSETYLKALCTMPLPKKSNEVPVSMIQRAMWQVNLGYVFLHWQGLRLERGGQVRI